MIASQSMAGEQLFEVFIPPVPVPVNRANVAAGGNSESLEGAVHAEVPPIFQSENPPGWQTYRLGAEVALNHRLLQQQVSDNLQDVFDALRRIFNRFGNDPTTPADPTQLETEWSVELAAPAPAQGNADVWQTSHAANEQMVQPTRPDLEIDLFACPDLLPREVPFRFLLEDSIKSWLSESSTRVPDDFLWRAECHLSNAAFGEIRATDRAREPSGDG